MDKKFLAILAVVIVGIIGVFLFTRSDTAESPSGSSGGTISNNSKGKLDSSVEVIEYADFQCPACGQFFAIVDSVASKYSDSVKFTFRHYPIDTIHPNARAAHRAAQSAANQGKFFEMHDKLFINQNAWSQLTDPTGVFESYAGELGLDIAVYKVDFAAAATNDIINADTAEGKSKGVSGTPSFFINGVKIENSELNTVEAFSAKIDEALAASKPAPAE